MLSEPPFEALFENVKHHAAVQSARKRYISRRVEILNNFLRIFFTTAAVPFTRALNRGVMLHMYNYLLSMESKYRQRNLVVTITVHGIYV